jgi:quinol monooxygenase YgiN
MTIIVAGHVDLDPVRRDAALVGGKPHVEGALTQRGCVRYAWTADPAVSGRVYVLEEWSDEAALAAHLAGPHYRAMLGHLQGFGITDVKVKKYRCDLSEPVYDANGVPRADFFTAVG